MFTGSGATADTIALMSPASLGNPTSSPAFAAKAIPTNSNYD
jgi:hypothetical protein